MTCYLICSLCSGEPFDPVPLLNKAVSNIICQIVFGRRFDYGDTDFQAMLTNLTDMAYLEGSVWALVRPKSKLEILLDEHCICFMFSLPTAV